MGFFKERLRPRRSRQARTETAMAFGRNRTLDSVGYQAKQELSDRQLVNLLARKRQKLISYLVGLLIGAGVVLILFWQLTISVAIFTPSSQAAINSDRYVKLVDQYLSIYPLQRLRSFIDHDRLQQFMLEQAPEVKTIRLESGGLATTNVKLVFRQPVAQWSAANQHFFVDGQGMTFEVNYFDQPSVVVKDMSGIPASGGQEVVNRLFLSFLGQTVEQFREHGMTVTDASLPADTVRQVEVSLIGRPYIVRLTLDRAARAQVEQAIKAIKFLDERSLVPEVVDVRVDQRVFYR